MVLTIENNNVGVKMSDELVYKTYPHKNKATGEIEYYFFVIFQGGIPRSGFRPLEVYDSVDTFKSHEKAAKAAERWLAKNKKN